MPAHACAACSTLSEAAAICSRCKRVWYCNAQCQRAHWTKHKPACKAPPTMAQALAPVEGVDAKPSPAVDASLSAMLGASASASASSASAKSAAGKASDRKPASRTADAAPVPVTFSLPASLHADHPLLEVRELAGRGRGFVAREAIEPGTLLLTESSIYAHAAHCNGNEEARIAALAGLTRVMVERYPAALEALCHHPSHELPEHPLLDSSPLPSLSLEQWHTALARVDSNCFSSSKGMMVSPAVSTCNHSCYPNADLIIRETQAPAAHASASASDPTGAAASAPAQVEQCFLYCIHPIAAGDEVTINYLGQDSLCRWYSPAMLRQESFESQWQFKCTCSRCEGNKARAIDRTLAYTPQGLDEELEERYAKLVLAEPDASGGPNPHALLQLYRDMYACFDGERFYHNYVLHQIRTMLLFMPAAFDGQPPPPAVAAAPAKGKGGNKKAAASASSSSSSSSMSSMSSVTPALTGESEWLQLSEHHLLSLRNNLLNPPLHSVKADSLAVLLRSSDFIGREYAEENAARARRGEEIRPNSPLRRRIAELAQEHDEVYFEEPAFAKLYPDVYASLQRSIQEGAGAEPAAAS